jgi:hypothetical protein
LRAAVTLHFNQTGILQYRRKTDRQRIGARSDIGAAQVSYFKVSYFADDLLHIQLQDDAILYDARVSNRGNHHRHGHD